MVRPKTKDGIYSLSFMYSLECNSNCSFCMYNCSPNNKEIINLLKLQRFINTIDFNLISAIGFFGGEISINTEGYQKIINMIPLDIPKFTITNGKWSEDKIKTQNFLEWANKNELEIFVSSTEEHKKNQNRNLLEYFESKGKIILKENDENLLPMGRLSSNKTNCKYKCIDNNYNIRITVKPDENILLQNCDGKHPVIGNINEEFLKIHTRLQHLKHNGFYEVCPYFLRRIINV